MGRAEGRSAQNREATGALPQDVLDERKKKASAVWEAVAAKESPPPPRELAKELEFLTPPIRL